MFSKKNPFYKGPKSDHFDGTHFFNPQGIKLPGFLDVIKWKLSSKPLPFPYRTLKKAKKKPILSKDDILVTFIGHACFLIESSVGNILIDPFYSSYAGPLRLKRNQRKTPPGIAFEDLPKIDYVLVSHNHYDHLDLKYLKKLNKKFLPTFIVPLGLDVQFKPYLTNTVALDWNESFSKNSDLSISLTQSQHWSCRTLKDKNMTLWGGFFLKILGKTIYFCGDSGFNLELFEDIKKRYQTFDCALLPIGAYHPRFFMKAAHMDPEEAVLVSQILQAKKSIGMHFNTLNLADESRDDPILDLEKAKEKHDLPTDAFITLDEGHFYLF
jgi:L-ascorbate metabolism protein UlaG (beta-lactamase superfamily)